jgi:hypothetical protein
MAVKSNFTYGSGNPLSVAPKPAPPKPAPKPAAPKPAAAKPAAFKPAPVQIKEPTPYIDDFNFRNATTGIYAKGPGGGPGGGGGGTESTVGIGGATAQTDISKDGVTKEDKDAFAALRELFKSYDLEDLAETITKLMVEGKTANEALMLLKYDKNYNQAYTARFKGNADRVSKGLNALSEAQYIANENAYAETLRAYGLNNMLSLDRKTNQAKFAQYIANDVSSTEFNDRVSTAVDNVINADPAVMNEFKTYYGGLTTSDVVSYFLAPTETLPILKQKAEAAAIGAESFKQGLGSNTAARSLELSKLGVSKEQARLGYSAIGEVLPESQKLSGIYQEAGINYDKTAGEQEFLLKNADAQRKRKQLASLERAKFSGDAGLSTTGGVSLGKTSYGKF